jgi:hypothetical protein
MPGVQIIIIIYLLGLAPAGYLAAPEPAASQSGGRPEPAARPPPKTTLEQDIDDEAKQMSMD